MSFGDIISQTTYSQVPMIVRIAEEALRLMVVRSDVASLTVSGSIHQKEN